MQVILALVLVCAVCTSCTRAPSASDSGDSYKVVLTSDVQWGPLNPARGDNSPKAGTLWGDRTAPGPSGFLVEFLDGFSSPPHIHNITYRGVVISGSVHNDDPDADEMYMPAGSFWSQPAGGVHITAARGRHNLSYIEIEEGPYLVLPVEEAFHSDDVPINVNEWDIAWINQPGMPTHANGPKVAFPWGKALNDRLSRALVKLPAGFAGEIHGHGATLRAVVIQGRPRYRLPDKTDVTTLEPGSCFSSEGESLQLISSQEAEETILYVRMEGNFDIIAAQTKK